MKARERRRALVRAASAAGWESREVGRRVTIRGEESALTCTSSSESIRSGTVKSDLLAVTTTLRRAPDRRWTMAIACLERRPAVSAPRSRAMVGARPTSDAPSIGFFCRETQKKSRFKKALAAVRRIGSVNRAYRERASTRGERRSSIRLQKGGEGRFRVTRGSCVRSARRIL